MIKRLFLLSISMLVFLNSCVQRTIDVIPYPNNIEYRSGAYAMSGDRELGLKYRITGFYE